MNNILMRVIMRGYSYIDRMRFGSFGAHSRLYRPFRIYNYKAVQVGNRVTIMENAWLNAKIAEENDGISLSIGDSCYIGRFVHINSLNSVVLEPDVLIADRVFISDEEHKYEDLSFAIKKQGTRYKGPVLLKTGCWICEGACILPGVTVGKHSIVAANAVVTKDVPEYCIAGGIPARIIKKLTQDNDHRVNQS